jgi:hypothetical protein
MSIMKQSLLAGVAISAVIAGSTGAFAQTPVDVGNISQTSKNTSNVNNNGSVTVHPGFFVAPTLGAGASAAVSATGAVASTDFSTIGGTLTGTTTGTVTQSATNGNQSGVFFFPNTYANVSNTGSVTVGALRGDGASASISGTGAVASLSISGIDTTSQGNFAIGAVSQGASNTGTVTNYGTISAGALSGTGSSASISASGAVASVSDSNILKPTGSLSSIPNTSIASISQTATNNAGSPISNNGTITVAGNLGTGASASVSAMGAGAVASFHSVK